jgi:transcriptional regulator with XRE-family HTH domain
MMDIDTQIADRLKSLRASRGWTLERLAASSGVSRAMISKIERRETSATAALLSRLCVALEVPVSDLLAPAESPGMVTRKGQRPSWRDPATGFVREIVSPRPAGSAVEVVEVELPPAANVVYRIDSRAHYSQHIVALTEGLRVNQGSDIDLGPGDALFMRPAGDVGFHNTSDHPCRYLVVVEHARMPT